MKLLLLHVWRWGKLSRVRLSGVGSVSGENMNIGICFDVVLTVPCEKKSVRNEDGYIPAKFQTQYNQIILFSTKQFISYLIDLSLH
jgi:hypothetical protein